MPDSTEDLRRHIDAAHKAAEQLVDEATRHAEEVAREQNRDVPPRGWAAPEAEAEAEATAAPDLRAILALLESIRGAIPPEISLQLAQALRELLLAVRALLDWYIERLESFRPGGPPGGPAVEDIPID